MFYLSGLAWARNAVASIRPIHINVYVDKVQIRLRHPLTLDDLHILKRHSRGKLHYEDMWQSPPGQQRPRCAAKYRFRLQLRQPDRAAIEFLAERDDLHLNVAEFALDWCFASWGDNDNAFLAVVICFVKQRHGKQHVNLHKRTFYSATFRAGNVFVCYADKPSRINNSPYCVHNEWRATGAHNVKRAGVTAIRDLLSFDHRTFWQQRLLLYVVDGRRLGREFNVKQTGVRRHRPWVEVSSYRAYAYRYDHDAVRGRLMMAQAMAQSRTAHRDDDISPRTQDIIDFYRGSLKVKRSLVRLDVGHLLPQAA
jgi:hypothetical protein